MSKSYGEIVQVIGPSVDMRPLRELAEIVGTAEALK